MVNQLNLRFLFAVFSNLLAHNLVMGSCGGTAIGLEESSKVEDARFSASSQYDVTTPAKNGRLGYTSGSSWCASSRESTPYLQVNLGSVYIICGVATQGNSQADQWVRNYQVQYSTDGNSWKVYRENALVKTFQGNYDRSTVVKRFLYDGVQAQYIRVLPKLHYNRACLRLELYGVTKQVCSSSAVGVADRTKVPDHRFSASSVFSTDYQPYYARLNNRLKPGWAPSPNSKSNSWLKIDLGNAFIICGIKTQGTYSTQFQEWTKKYKLRLSIDNVTWQYYQENGTDKVFIGNTDNNGIVQHSLNQGSPAKLIEVRPTEYEKYPTIRLEIYGVTQGCRSSLGIETSGGVLNSQLTASSGNTSDGRLYKPSTAWCSATRSNTEYLQVDLKRLVTLTGVSTQGHPTRQEWIKTFIIKYSFDNSEWFELKDGEKSVKTFNSVDQIFRTIWFKHPFVARYVRINPQTWQQTPCLRFDLYGCDNVNSPKVSVQGATSISGSGANTKVTIVMDCRARGQPTPDIKWKNGATDVTSQARLLSQSQGFTHSKLTFQVPLSQLEYQISCQNQSSRLVRCSWQSYKCGASYPEVHGGARSFAQTSLSVHLDPLRPRTAKVSIVITTDTAVTLTIAPYENRKGKISFYQVIVIILEEKNQTVPKGFKFSESKNTEINFYIAMEIPAEKVTSKKNITIGDGKIYRHYLNAKLEEGRRYVIYFRAVSNVNEKTFVGKPSKLADVFVAKPQTANEPRKSTGWSSASTIILVVLAVLVVVLAATTMYLFCWRMKRRSEQRGIKSLQPALHYAELNKSQQKEQRVYQSLQQNRCSTEKPTTDDSFYENDIDCSGGQESTTSPSCTNRTPVNLSKFSTARDDVYENMNEN